MSYTVRLTDTAKQDLREIAFWIAEKSKDREIAKRFVGELREACRKLDTFPNAGGIPKDRIIRSAGYRFTVHKEYLIPSPAGNDLHIEHQHEKVPLSQLR